MEANSVENQRASMMAKSFSEEGPDIASGSKRKGNMSNRDIVVEKIEIRNCDGVNICFVGTLNREKLNVFEVTYEVDEGCWGNLSWCIYVAGENKRMNDEFAA